MLSRYHFFKVLQIILLTLFTSVPFSLRGKAANLISTQIPIRAIVFDLGGVVVQADPTEAANFIVSTFLLSKEEAKEIVIEYKSHWINGGNEKQFWENFSAKKGIDLPENWLQQWESVLLCSIKEIPGIIELIQELKNRGFVVALLSNARKDQAAHIQKMGYYNFFQPALISCEIGYDKPDPRAFQILLKELQLSPEFCVFIDDKIENVEAAKKMGIDGIQFANCQQLKEELANRNILFSQKE